MTNSSTYRLLALCARAECDKTHYGQLAQQAAQLTTWQGVSALAEAHGMAPLLYTHLKAAGVQLPPTVKRELQGLYLRHRHANQVRTRVLRDILAAYSGAGIQTLVLKGAALSHLVYPEPALRPMTDVDILVPKPDLWRAQNLLAGLGFSTPLPPGSTLPARHLPAATLQSEGLAVRVELHHRLHSTYFHDAVSYAHALISPARRKPRPQSAKPGALTIAPHTFTLDGATAHTLGYEDALQHLCQHLASHVNVWDYCRLIWIADVVSLAERFVAEIDWARVRRQSPEVLDMLSLFHFLTPLSGELLSQSGVKIGRAPKGIGIEYRGWPRPSAERRTQGEQRTQGEHVGSPQQWRSVLRDTFFPSEWWLRLRYKLGSTRPLFWPRWVRHPFYILGHIARAILERLGWPSPVELTAKRTPERPT